MRRGATLVPGDGGGWIQVERGARPAQAVILVERKDAYFAGEPRTMSVSLLPSRTLLSTRVDIRQPRQSAWQGHCSLMFCLYDPMRPASFPDNGRTLTDDAFDVLFASSQMERDGRQRRGPWRPVTRLSYVGPPHQSRAMKTPHKKTATQNQNETE